MTLEYNASGSMVLVSYSKTIERIHKRDRSCTNIHIENFVCILIYMKKKPMLELEYNFLNLKELEYNEITDLCLCQLT